MWIIFWGILPCLAADLGGRWCGNLLKPLAASRAPGASLCSRIRKNCAPVIRCVRQGLPWIYRIGCTVWSFQRGGEAVWE